MKSLWREQTGDINVNGQVTAECAQNIHWDVIVVGAGMAGLLTAYYLKEEGKKVLVLEAGEIASGQTERTTAKITSQHGLKYSSLIKSVGAQKAKLYAQANEAAIEEYDKLIKEKKIDCQFERIPSYLYTKQDVALLHEEAAAATFLGMDAFFTKETELPFEVEGAVCFRNQAQFAPLEFVRYISAELNILEHTQVLKIRGHKVITKDSVFLADKIVVATHYPMVNVPGFYFIRQHQERSYALALSGCHRIKGMYYGIDKGAHSFRQAGEYLLLGGSSGRTGEINCGTAYDMLQKAAEEYYPDCKEVFRWAAQDCMPHDGIPFIGKYSVFTPHLYVATGFQKWGMTSSMIAATLLRDALCGFENPYAALFSPQRINFRAAYKNLFHDIGMSAKGLSKGLLHKNGPRCSHMGCELVWNPEEKSWDCPCHGSRFTEEGTFNLNSGLYAPEGTVYLDGTIHRRMTKQQVTEAYTDSGMEVAVHGLTHPFLEQLPANLCLNDVVKDRENLEEQFGTLIRGMAYPFGTYSDEVVECLKCAGIVYSRTVISTGDFRIPTDWLRLTATCHHNDPRLMELARKFVEEDTKRAPWLFYLWGHSYEFEANDNWEVIEKFAEYTGGKKDIWYATNIEIYDYVEAYRKLVYSMDGHKVFNPTAYILYFEKDGEVHCVNPGESVQINVE